MKLKRKGKWDRMKKNIKREGDREKDTRRKREKGGRKNRRKKERERKSCLEVREPFKNVLADFVR